MNKDTQREIRKKISEIERKSANGDYIYRGEPEDYGKVSSSLWREYGIEAAVFDIEVVQKEMLNDAKKHIGHLPQDFRMDFEAFPNVVEKDTDETIDFEILTEIQHYSGETNLIDFTTDYFIALFFACDGHHNELGRVILQKTEEIKNMIKHPRNPRHRIITQKSVFVRPPKGFIEPHEGDIVIIPRDLKQWILQHLRKYHGISTETIYNDLHGFIRNQGIHGGAYTQFYRGFVCQERGNEATISEEKREEYEKAIKHYTQAIQLKPNLAEAYNNRGSVHRDLGNFDDAITDLDKAIDLDPNYAEAYSSRGLAYKQRGNYECAIVDLDKAIALNPNYVEAYNNRGNTYSRKGKHECAIAEFNKAIQLKPDYAEAYNNRGTAYGRRGNYECAIVDLDKAIALNPNYAGAYSNRGNAYIDKGEYERAIVEFNKAIQLKPDYAEAYNNRGNAYYKRGDYRRALEDYTKAIDLNPNYTNAYNNREVVQRELERLNEPL